MRLNYNEQSLKSNNKINESIKYQIDNILRIYVVKLKEG